MDPQPRPSLRSGLLKMKIGGGHQRDRSAHAALHSTVQMVSLHFPLSILSTPLPASLILPWSLSPGRPVATAGWREGTGASVARLTQPCGRGGPAERFPWGHYDPCVPERGTQTPSRSRAKPLQQS